MRHNTHHETTDWGNWFYIHTNVSKTLQLKWSEALLADAVDTHSWICVLWTLNTLPPTLDGLDEMVHIKTHHTRDGQTSPQEYEHVSQQNYSFRRREVRRSPVNVHFLRRLGCFVISDFSGNPEDYNKSDDPTGDVDRGVGLVHAGVVRITCWGWWRGHSFHPVRLVVVLACSLVQPVAFELAAEAQVTGPATVAVIGVIALELLVELAAHVVVPEAGLVRARLDDALRGRGRRDGGSVQFLRFLRSFGCGFGSFGSQGAEHVERVQIDEQQQKVSNPHGAARRERSRWLRLQARWSSAVRMPDDVQIPMKGAIHSLRSPSLILV